MHYLIDGHNLIGKMPDIDLADPNDEVKLILRLRSWAAAGKKRRVTVIFDGGLPGGKAKNLSTTSVQVIFAPSGKTADALLVGRIMRLRNPREYTLVSSDQFVIAAAQQRGMPHRRAEKFVQRHFQTRLSAHEKEEESPATAVDPQVSDSEVTEFLELFGTEVEQEPSKRTSPKTQNEKKPRKPRQSLEDAKSGSDPLKSDEIEEWLRLFGGKEGQ